MKIVVIFPKDSEALFNQNSARTFGGASVQMYLIAKELNNRRDIETYSFIPDYETIDFQDTDAFKLIKVFCEKDPPFVKVVKLHNAINKIKPDVIIQRGLTLYSCLLARYCTFRGIKFVYMFAHDLEVEGKYQRSAKNCVLFPMLLKNAHRLITQNEYQKNALERRNIESCIIKNGFVIDKMPKEKENFILWVARSDAFKKPELVLALAKQNPDLRFVMICPLSSNTTKEKYGELKNEAQRISNITSLEFIRFQDIEAYFKKAKIFINTSDYEGFPQTFVQATMWATPILSLNSNPNNFLNKYKCGFCANGDLVMMGKQVRALLTDEKFYSEMSDNAYRYALANHSITRNVNLLVQNINQQKILHIINSSELGGAQTVLRYIISKQNYPTFCLRRDKVERFLEVSPKVYFGTLSKFYKYNPAILYKLWSLVKREKVNILHVHLAMSLGYAMVIKMFQPKIKLIYHVHGEVYHSRKLQYLLRVFKNKIDLFIAVSGFIKSELQRISVPENKITVLYNSVDIVKFKPPNRPNTLSGRVKVGFAGRIIAGKGWREVIDVARKIKEHDNRVIIYIAGEGPEENLLLEQIKQHDLGKIIKLLGYVENMPDFYAGLDLFIMPSHHEGLSLVQLEVVAAGIPLITSNGRGLDELFKDREECLYFQVGDSNDLYNKMKLLIADADMRGKLVKNGLEKIKTLSLEKHLHELDNIYTTIK